MKKIVLLFVLLFQLTISFGQTSQWAPYVKSSCYQGISSTAINYGYNQYGKGYQWNWKVKNNYTKTVTFNLSIKIGTDKKDWGVFTLEPGKEHQHVSMYYSDPSVAWVIEISEVFFGTLKELSSERCWAKCDNGIANCDKNTANTTASSNNSSNTNNLTEYNRSKQQLEEEMNRKNTEITKKNQENTKKETQFLAYYNAGVKAFNNGNSSEAASQFQQAIPYAVTDEQRNNAQNNYNKAVKNNNRVQTIEAVKPALVDAAKSIDQAIAANRERKAATEEEKKRIEEERNNIIIANQDYYFRITSKDDNEMGQYCDYVVSLFQKAGYTFIDISSPAVYRDSNKEYNIETSKKSIAINFKDGSKTLEFRMSFDFTLGKYVNGFIRRCWLTNKLLPNKETIVIAKSAFGNSIELTKTSDQFGYFELKSDSKYVSDYIKTNKFSNTNYKGFVEEQKKANALNNNETVKSYLENAYKFYKNMRSGDANDTEQAIYWYKKAADSANTVGMRFLSEIYVKTNNYDVAEQWAEKAVKLGDTLAYTMIGNYYGSARQPATAIVWYKKAIALNHTSGYRSLADAYRYGNGVEADGKEAERLYKIGAEKGDYLSMQGLELLYKYGAKNIKKSNSKTKEWHDKTCKAFPPYCKND